MSHIERRGESSYRLIINCGYDSQGKKITKKKTINLSHIPHKKREDEANKQWLLFQAEVEKGTFLDGGKITFEELTVRWIEDYAEKHLAPKTLHRYKELLNSRILPAIGNIKLDKLQPTHLMQFYNNLSEKGIRLDVKFKPKANFLDLISKQGIMINTMKNICKISSKAVDKLKKGQIISKDTATKVSLALDVKISYLFDEVEKEKGLSDRTILHHHRVISAILQDAVEWQLIMSNPAERVKSPKVKKSSPTVYDETEIIQLMEALDSEPIKYKVMVILDIFTGLRCGELMGLDWSDIDMSNRIISVNKASQYVSGKGVFTKETKNDSSVRVIVVPELVIELLKQYKSTQTADRLKCGDLWQGSNRVFTTFDGKPMFTYALSKWLTKFLKRHNLTHITPHSLRHSSASLLLQQGLDIASVSKRLGHARISTTADIYAHAFKKGDYNASEILNNTLGKNRENIKETSLNYRTNIS